MFRLASLSNLALAQQLCDRLEAAQIQSVAELNVGVLIAANVGQPADVWVKDEDVVSARPIATAFLEELSDRSDGVRCAGCGYSLEGHVGEGLCPECGKSFRRPAADVMCTECSEHVPATFDICWNCGATISSEA